MGEPRQGWEADVQVEARGVELGYGRACVLSGVELAVRRGEFWCLVGPNGSGKTTLMRAILAPRMVRSGALSVRVPRARIGYVPQRCDLNPTVPTTVREFVSLGFVGTGAAREERRKRLAWALERVRLENKLAQSYWVLSGGQRQRALVARALVRRPELLLLDEPTTGLDLAGERAVLEALGRLHVENGMTVVCVTHDLRLPARYATHVAVFYAQGVVAGPRQEVLQPTLIERAYGVGIDPAELMPLSAVRERGRADVR